uniref:Uncharacterized protein n=1 Tax=Anguilla anguilla TaxID=7936 RepID=A0A0E9VVR1_ANGAN
MVHPKLIVDCGLASFHCVLKFSVN